MSYYVAITVNSRDEITMIHPIDFDKKTLYNGTSQIKNSIFQDIHFKPNTKTYSYIFLISKKQFNDILELSFKDIERIDIKDFLNKYELQEYLI